MQLAMKVNFLERQIFPLGLLAQDSLSGVAALVRGVFTKTRGDGAEKGKLSYWQLIFLQSKANGCSYRGERLPQMKWQWPRDTWFQEQLSHRLKVLESAAHQTRKRLSPGRDRIIELSHGVTLPAVLTPSPTKEV